MAGTEQDTASATPTLDEEPSGSRLEEAKALLAGVRDTLEQESGDLEEEKRAMKALLMRGQDIIKLNVGGTIMTTSRSTLCQVEGSLLAAMFSDRWEEKMQRDESGAFFLDMDPYCMSNLISHLRHMALAGPQPIEPPQIDANKQQHWIRLLEFLGLKDAINSKYPSPLPPTLKFTRSSPFLALGDGGRKVACQQSGNKASTIVEPGFTTTSLWRVHLELGSCTSWVMLGVNSRPSAKDEPADASTYGWASSNCGSSSTHIYTPTPHKGVWGSFKDVDLVALKLDLKASSLLMCIPSTSQVFRISLPASQSPSWYAYISLSGDATSVQIMPAKPGDGDLFC